MARISIQEVVNQIGQQVTVAGWVHSRRDHGKLIFIDLRDRTGLLQVVFEPKSAPEAHAVAQQFRPECCVQITGQINARPERMVNPNIGTGKVEMLASAAVLLTVAETPPFEIDKDTRGVNEELRMKYRYLDLRTERMLRNLTLRHRVIKFIRDWLDARNFLEISTPMLTKSTPEGARDFIVPSRLHPGKFYALPQSPQQYKQLLMVAGIERYFQIAACFRDEDARADRSPGEFYQLDLEVSFMTQKELLDLMEQMFIDLVKTVTPEKKLTFEPFPRISWQESMDKYGTDKPDLRKDKQDPNELAFCWIVDFPLFEQAMEDGHYAPSHHMFTAPKQEDVPLLDTDPGKAKSYQHDLALNGFEVGGGSIRIHDPKIQSKIFDLIGFSDRQKQYFQHMLEAFKYGAPPHGGIAPGIDRLVMLLAGEETIREVIAFPKSGDARDVMMDAPSEVDGQQLKDVHIKLDVNKK